MNGLTKSMLVRLRRMADDYAIEDFDFDGWMETRDEYALVLMLDNGDAEALLTTWRSIRDAMEYASEKNRLDGWEPEELVDLRHHDTMRYEIVRIYMAEAVTR